MRLRSIRELSRRDSSSFTSFISFYLLNFLSIFFIHLLNPSALIKRQIKHLMLPHQNPPKLLLLRQRYRLQLHHLQHRQERHNHRVPRRTRLKKVHQIHRIVRARQNLRPDLRDHLRYRKLFVPQLDPRHFLPPLQHLLEHFHQIHQRNHQIALGPFVVIERLVRLRPHVLFNLLLLVQKLSRVLEFLVFHQALHQFRPRITRRVFRLPQRIRRQQHFRLDVNQRSRHINKFRRNIHVQLFQFVQILQILRRDFRNLYVVNIHLLLLNQIQQQVQWPLIHRYIYFVRRRHSFLLFFLLCALCVLRDLCVNSYSLTLFLSLRLGRRSTNLFPLLLPTENCLPYPFHRPLRHHSRFLRPRIQNVQHALRVLLVLHPPFPHRRNPFNQMVRHLRLALDAPNPRRPAPRRRPIQRLRRREQFMPVIHRTHVRISRIRPPLPRRVRHHHLRLFPYLLIRLAQRYRIPITLRHLPPIQPGNAWGGCQQSLRFLKGFQASEESCMLPDPFKKILRASPLREPPKNCQVVFVARSTRP